MAQNAQITPTSVITENLGGLTLYKLNFAASKFTGTSMICITGIPSVVGYWFQATNSTTQTNEGVDVSLLGASVKSVGYTSQASLAAIGQFKFNYGITGKAGDLYVLALT